MCIAITQANCSRDRRMASMAVTRQWKGVIVIAMWRNVGFIHCYLVECAHRRCSTADRLPAVSKIPYMNGQGFTLADAPEVAYRSTSGGRPGADVVFD